MEYSDVLQHRETRRTFLKMSALGAAAMVPASSVFGQADAGKVTIYSGQHESLGQALADAFTAATGIAVDLRTGKDADLANQIIEEGDKTNADVFITEEPTAAGMLDSKGLFAPINAESLALTDARFNPENGHWLAYAARSRVMFYNPDLIAEDELPASLFDLVNDEWAGKFAYAPSGAFTSTTVYLINTVGEDETLAWLKAIEKNGENLLKNGAVRDAVEAGQISFGLSNHYYWYILADEKGGEDNLTSRVHFVKGQDPAGLMLASAAGVLAASQNQDAAQQFIAWLADPEGGQAVIGGTTPQYPLAPGVESSFGLPALSELDPPVFDQGTLQDTDKARDLIIEAGII